MYKTILQDFKIGCKLIERLTSFMSVFVCLCLFELLIIDISPIGGRFWFWPFNLSTQLVWVIS